MIAPENHPVHGPVLRFRVAYHHANTQQLQQASTIIDSLTLGQTGALCISLMGTEQAAKFSASSAKTVLLMILTNFAGETPKDADFLDGNGKPVTFPNPLDSAQPIGSEASWKQAADKFNSIDILGNCQALFNKLELYEAQMKEKVAKENEREAKEQQKAAKDNNADVVIYNDLPDELRPKRRDVTKQHNQVLSACKEMFESAKSSKDFFENLQIHVGGYSVPPTTVGVDFSKEDTVLYSAMTSLSPVYDHLLGLKKTISELHPEVQPGSDEARLREEVEVVSVMFCQALATLEFRRKQSYKGLKPYVTPPFAAAKKPLLDTTEAKEVKKVQQAAKIFQGGNTTTTTQSSRGNTSSFGYGGRRRFRGFRRSQSPGQRSNSGGRGRGGGGRGGPGGSGGRGRGPPRDSGGK